MTTDDVHADADAEGQHADRDAVDPAESSTDPPTPASGDLLPPEESRLEGAENPDETASSNEDEDETSDVAVDPVPPEDDERFLTPGPAPEERFADVAELDDTLATVERTVFASLDDDLGTCRTPSVLLYGPRGTGKRRVARAIAGELGDRGFAFDQVRTLHREEVPAPDTMSELVEQATERAPLVLLLDCFDEVHGMGAAHEFGAALDDLRRSGAPVVIVGVMHERRIRHEPMRSYFRTFDVRVELEAPDRTRRAAVLRDALADAVDAADTTVDCAAIDVDELARLTEGFGVDDLRSAVRRSVLRCHAADPTLDTATLRRTLETVDGERLETVTAEQAVRDIDVSDVSFEDVGGLEAAKDRLHELLHVPIERADAFAAFDLPTNSGVLLHGPPGNGKTLLAKAVANETGRTFVSVAGPELVNPLGTGTEQRLRTIFEKARRNAPAVVFFDEFDSIGTERGLYDGAKDDVVNTLLTELDGLHGNDDVVVIAATNRMETLDPALLRPGRFEHLVEVAPPDDPAQREIFAVHTESLPLASDVTAEWFVRQTDDPSGADVATICSRAAVAAIRRTDESASPEAVTVTRADFREALSAFAASQTFREQAEEPGMFQ
jgi:transitional endoplasmic reticulum ATPase